MRARGWTAAAAALVCAGAVGEGHPLSFGALEVRDLGGARYAVRWRYSGTEVAPRGVAPRWPEGCRDEGERAREALSDGGEDQRWTVRCAAPMAWIALDGVRSARVQVWVRYRGVGGAERASLRTDDAPWGLGGGGSGGFSDALRAGVEHLGGGYDHLAFLAGLLLWARTRGRVLAAVTAFTAGHSVTLALAALGWVRPSTAAVEALIAWSLVVVARAVLRRERETEEGAEQGAPWRASGAFGLLHGFGFAGALAAWEPRRGALVTNLAGFNLGIELGQVALVLGLGWALERAPRRARKGLAGAVGVLGAWLLLERVAVLWG